MISWISCILGAAVAGEPVALESTLTTPPAVEILEGGSCDLSCCPERGWLQSDHCFDNFIGPITNPVYTKDPRSLTEARALFINNWTNPNQLLGPGNYQVYALQVRVALTERLQLLADKDGYAVINPDGGDELDGWLNVAAGLKYVLIRDVERQFITSVGFQYELPSGEAEVLQGHGDGMLDVFCAMGKELGNAHLLANFGQNFAIDNVQNSSYFYTQLHLDYGFWNRIYPLVELNWFHYTSGGNRGIPPNIGPVVIGKATATSTSVQAVSRGTTWSPPPWA